MNTDPIFDEVEHCIIGELNKKLTLIMKNGNKIIIRGKETVIKLYYLINGRN